MKNRNFILHALVASVLHLGIAGSVFAQRPPVGEHSRHRAPSPAAPAAAVPARLDDSGQMLCYAGADTQPAVPTPCSDADWPGQDGASGRDADAAGRRFAKLGGGDASFDFSKISNAGAVLPYDAVPGDAPGDWGCTRDNITGLVWRVPATTGVSWSQAQQVAADADGHNGQCGYRDWRLPAAGELLGIVHFGAYAPAVDATYFPATASGFHWTSEADPAAPQRRARVVNLKGGFAHAIEATQPAAALLVRGGSDFGPFRHNVDGTVTDPRTGLTWDTCSLGQDAAKACAGDPTFVTWQDALGAAREMNAGRWRGHADWRLPNAKELASLVDAARYRPAIDAARFPNTASSAYWSSTTDVHASSAAWTVFFGGGDVFAKQKMTRAAVRLVRSGVAASTAMSAIAAPALPAGAPVPAQTPADTLPTIDISTEGAAPIVSEETYLDASMTITLADGSPSYAGTLRIKGRGNSTWTLPKKPYRLKLDSKDKLLGMHSDKNWALLANYSDKTLLRNLVAQTLGQRLHMAWSPDSRFANVVLNGQYQGIYQLIETIRVDSNRVDIAEIEPTDIASPEVTGGYLFEIDQRLDCDPLLQYVSAYDTPICIDTPDEDAIVPQQYDYLTDYIRDTEDALYAPGFADPADGYRAWLDPASFIDWYLVNELTANTDAADYSSIWNYKDRDGLLERGPLWDFDISIGNADYCPCTDPQGFWIRGGIWYSRLFEDPWFAAQVRARWDEVKADTFDTLPALIDDEANTIRGAVDANFRAWPIFDDRVWPNAIITGSWEGDLAYSKDWLLQRIDWLDANL